MKNTMPLLLIISISLTACAMQEGDFPSLAKRPYEDVGATLEEADPVPVPTISSLPDDIRTKLDRALAQNNIAHAKFLRNLPTVKRRVQAARGSAVSSEAWVVAQMDLAALEIDRGPSVQALADVDALYTQRADAEFDNAIAGGAAIIAEEKKRIERDVQQQQNEIDAMQRQLR